MRNLGGIAVSAALLGCAAGCDAGAKSHGVPWGGDGTAHVLDANRQVQSYTAPDDPNACLETPDSNYCVKPQQACDGAAEVVLDEQGKVIATACYPQEATLSVAEVAAQDGNVAQNQNNAVIVLKDPNPDQANVEGDLSVDANNVVVYGDSPDTASIAGDVTVDGNNIVVRGVTIQGDVDILANDAVFLYCVIEGNVTVHGNNAILAACDVFGDVTVHGNNTQLSGNHIVGSLSDGGKNTVCDENLSATDKNHDGVLSTDELGAVLTCK